MPPLPDSAPSSIAERRRSQLDRPISLWRNGDFLLLSGGQALSDIGGAISELAFPLLALAVTHSAAQAGFMAALRALPGSIRS